MDYIHFEGHIEEIRTTQLELIVEVLEKQGYAGSTAIISAVAKIGENYIANMKRITVERNGKVFKMIAKFASDNFILRSMTNTALMFNNEITIYTEFLPKFAELEMYAGIPEKDRFRHPKCYAFILEEPNELILLEDLSVLNFKTLDKFKSLTDEYVRSVVKNFACFHSLSYAFKEKEPSAFNNRISKLVDLDNLPQFSAERKAFSIKLEEITLSLLVKDEHKQLIKNSISQIQKMFSELSKTDKGSKYSVVVHGDAWSTNMMFKNQGDVVQSILVDYQMSRALHPVYDLLQMIFNCTDYKSRSQHFHDWIDFYHKELEKCLEKHGIDVEHVYPRYKLDEDIRRYRRNILAICILCSVFIVKKSDDISKIRDSSESLDMTDITKFFDVLLDWDDEIEAVFKARIEDLADSFIELGLN